MWLLRICFSCIKLTPYSSWLDLKKIRRHWNFRCCLFSKTSDVYLSQLIIFYVKVLLCVFFEYSKSQIESYPIKGTWQIVGERFKFEELFLEDVVGFNLRGQVTWKLFQEWSYHFATSSRWGSEMKDDVGAWKASFWF